MKQFIQLVMVVSWVFGIAVAKGFWMTVACAFMPLVAWVVLAMHVMGQSA